MKCLLAVPLLLIAVSVQAEQAVPGDVAVAEPVLASLGFEADRIEASSGPRPPVRVPRTEFDTAHRFNMDSGKKLTAVEFDAWLASMGARVVVAEVAVEATVEAVEVAEAVAPSAADPLDASTAPVKTLPAEPLMWPALPQAVKYQVVE